jgi:hypothetical protein
LLQDLRFHSPASNAFVGNENKAVFIEQTTTSQLSMSDHPPAKGASLDVRQAWELQMQKKLVQEDMDRPKAFKLGMITDSGYICIGDPYKAPGDAFDGGSRTKGLNFKVQGTKKGQFGKGVRFTPLNPLCIGDPYMSAQEKNFVAKKKAREDAKKLRTESRREAAIKQGKNPDDIDDQDPPGWVPAPPFAPNNDIFLARCDKSTSDEEVLRIIRGQRTDHAARNVRDENGDVKTAPPNIRASKMKTNIIDAVHMYPWMPDPDTGDITNGEKWKRIRQAAAEATDTKPPFRPTRPMQTNIIDAVEMIPWMPETDPNKPSMAELLKKRRAAAEGADPPSPWRPSNPLKTSIFDMTSKFPEHIPCPDTAPERVKRGQEEDDGPAFKPVGKMQSRPVYSVALNKRNLGAYKSTFYATARASLRGR